MKDVSTAKKDIGKAIRAAREKLRMSQETLSYECNLHRTYISSVERGERNISLINIIKIASVLNMSGSELLKQAGL